MSRIIPHLHFCGDCKDAIALYKKAFNGKRQIPPDTELSSEPTGHKQPPIGKSNGDTTNK